MSHNQAPQAILSTVTRFPAGYLLENLAVRSDNSVLITAMLRKELWYVPSAVLGQEVTPLCIHSFEQYPTGIAEVEPDVFLIVSGDWYGSHESYAHKVDLRSWQPGSVPTVEFVCKFPEEARGLNGCCVLSPGVVLVADCFASLIWRLDLGSGHQDPQICVWKQHESMGYYPGRMRPEQPGVNGIRFARKSHFLYYTITAKKLLLRQRVEPGTWQAEGEPELVVAGRMGDDFCIDETANVLLATHRQNTIDLVSLEPGLNSGFTQTVAGDPFSRELAGPSSAAWRRGSGDQGAVLYVTTDGGTASPPPDGPGPARLIRADLALLHGVFPGSASSPTQS